MRGYGQRIGAAVTSGLLVASPAAARDESAARGEAFARAHCARCHATGSRGAGSLRQASPFRTLARRFPVDDLADVLAEGVDRRHPAMPDFRLDPADAADLTAYLKTLRP
ncbi:c-type cytochrome [Methylorubrum suomiense]|uniref:Cytochrome c domain-containing protein n=1 Tax=Methylorubrum suomiense TaxID=144191 RepID=A0ABQ4UTG3_9HYPH|nr:cytochrome c [Methylorubrum suomiense]GJE74312.1 hypothetical protein BGCPKDLD_0881 [Methylorubrum suomiense]